MRHARFSFALALILCLGCASILKPIPLFSSDATPLTRLASADEILIELNGLTADLRDDGTITQDFIDHQIGPQLDDLRRDVRTLRAAYKLGNGDPLKLDNLAKDLKDIRNRLRQLQRK